jgi:imidazolonepropionase-like amidohydrolase
MGERIGKIKSGFDADIVVWDSDPLSIGATPVQVWIDGTAQFPDAVKLNKPSSKPIIPNESLSAEIVEEPPVMSDAIFAGVAKIMIPGFEQVFESERLANVVVKNGVIVCTGICASEIDATTSSNTKRIELQSGYISPSFIGFGSVLGLVGIDSEDTTQNGDDNRESFSRAIDGLQLNSKHLKATYSHGVTKAISAPVYRGGGHQGVSVGFSTGALHPLEDGAIWSDEISLHYTLSLAAKQGKTPSISSAVGDLRHKLLTAVSSKEPITDKYSEAAYLKRAVSGEIPLVITVHSVDTIAAILRVKSEVEAAISATAIQNLNSGLIRLVIYGGAESHLVAKQIAAASVSVVVAPVFAYSMSWDQKRSLTGAPVTNGTAIDVLIDAGVTTAIGTAEAWEIRDLSLLAGIVYKNGGGKISEADALALIGKNYESILGTKIKSNDFVVFEGSPFEIDSKVKAVGSQGRVSIY